MCMQPVYILFVTKVNFSSLPKRMAAKRVHHTDSKAKVTERFDCSYLFLPSLLHYLHAYVNLNIIEFLCFIISTHI